MTDLEQAKTLLASDNGYTCVLCRGDQVYTSTIRGVAPMVDFLAQGTDLTDFSAADRVVGRAAAFLFAHAGVRAVYAPVMSDGALQLFAQYDIQAQCDTVTETIINRSGTDRCPMEKAVTGIDTPEEALSAIQDTLRALRAQAGAQ